ncbi:MAG TPA: hypothetical protein VHU41_11760 [Thermoanaerobaculia bacterium]|jgi:hypothetical protein|nr:hypothetical protein [Thermoanaerobaculia bacterium]
MKSKTFAVILILAIAITAIGSTTAPQSQPLTVHQQSTIVGGNACEFGAGFSVGLGVAGLFGCVVCGVGSLAIDVAELIWC